MRTAAASAVATKYLASKESKHLAILGAGTQARSHYQALCHIYNFEKIFIWNINAENAIKLRDEIQDTGKQCIACHTVKDAVETADIIVTATMAQKPILKKEWVKMGAHINGKSF
ncbi:ketimine reductase mu-crystallin-like [Stegodyphus dumicola]|uniref:ketimine reductase mu-crystallin-like n=1 Tax=Stegodyphus dumicola TaxID=202533 RepID=UPI0015B07024|nr:ketimine reductase mu-crystallin-like [Stegodyphus dumicola]